MNLLEVTELFEYLNYHPSTAEIMCARYDIKVGKHKFTKPVESDFNRSISEAAMMASGSNELKVEKPPEDFLANIKFAEEMMSKLTKGVN